MDPPCCILALLHDELMSDLYMDHVLFFFHIMRTYCCS
jgi:hypothetical protein